MRFKELFLIEEHDFTGLKCPLPVLKAKRVLKNLVRGKKVVFISDDPASPIDFNHFQKMKVMKFQLKAQQKVSIILQCIRMKLRILG